MAYCGDEDQDDAIMAGTICPECHRGKVAGALTCAKCKNAHVKNVGKEARAQVNEAKYKAFVEAESLAIMKRSLQDLGDQINRSNAIAAKKQKCMEAVPAIMQALPAVLATGGKFSNPFAVSKAQKNEARQRQAQQAAASQEAAAAQHQARQRQAQEAPAPQQQAAPQTQQHAAQLSSQLQHQAAQLKEQAVVVHRERAELAQERAKIAQERAELARQKAPGPRVRDLKDLSLEEREEERRARADAAADAAANREVDEIINAVYMDTSK